MRKTAVKMPLSEGAIREIRSFMAHQHLGDEEIMLLAEVLWHWSNRMRLFGAYTASTCRRGSINLAPFEVRKCHEKLFLWVVPKLKDGHRIVAVDVNDKKTVEPPLHDWFKHFTPTISIAS